MAKRRITTTHPHTTKTPEALAQALVARADLIPDFTELGDADEERALLEAYIEHHCAEDCQEELRAFLRGDQATSRALYAALPDSKRQAFIDYENRRGDFVWIHQAIGYLIGVEVGRRLR